MITRTEDKGIYPKYIVFKHPEVEINQSTMLGLAFFNGEKGPASARMEVVDDFVFVLKPITDKHARVALAAYAQSVVDEKPQLAADIREVLSDF